nr:pyruvate carboxylase [Neopyropia yezoensis]
MFGTKTSARELATTHGVPVIPGTPGPVGSLEEGLAFGESVGYPLMVKAISGGGGKGMRVVASPAELEDAMARCRSEGQTSFGNDQIYMEKFLERPRHIEVQVLADADGDVITLFERNCSIQRRHQKVVEVAPAAELPMALRERLWDYAKMLTKAVGYRNAGTVEFLVDAHNDPYFIEVNPRLQVEHTVSEEITQVDIVQSQLRLAEGHSLASLGLTQDAIKCTGVAIQTRVTSENPAAGFVPDYGRIDTFRAGSGAGIRLDSAAGFSGALITPHYDSLLMKVTAHAATYGEAAVKLHRALGELRCRGIKTNVPFLRKVLVHPVFLDGSAATDFIDIHPELFKFPPQRDRGNKVLRYLAEVKVNGHPMPGADASRHPSTVRPVMPVVDTSAPAARGWKDVLNEEGPTGFAAAVRAHPRTLVADTTFRDAHQSLLATRVRTTDLAAIAPATARALTGAYASECWLGATFDTSMRFLRECPWERLRTLRTLMPNVPLQCLLRGANAGGYGAYPDNVVYAVCAEAVKQGMDVFRVFDALNYTPNLLLGCDAVAQAGGVVQGEFCYTGDVLSPAEGSPYTMDYYLRLADTLVKEGKVHVLGIKDMAGLLKPAAATALVGALRAEFPDTPIHVHTHDTAGTGVASMLAAAVAGADVVHGAIDAMAGTTSQPSLGALVASLADAEAGALPAPAGHPADVVADDLTPLHDYWAVMRGHYAPFEQGADSTAPDVYRHEIPGGQYSNLKVQSSSMGLASQWLDVKAAYTLANRLLGSPVKVTPTSKVVGDLAQFLLINKIDSAEAFDERLASSASLNLPGSVIDFLQGKLGQPVGGFPEPTRSIVLERARLAPISGRPGAELSPLDLDALERELTDKHGDMLAQHGMELHHHDVLSAALYPAVFDEWMAFRSTYSDAITRLPTNEFLHPMAIGQEFSLVIEDGKTLMIKLLSVSETLDAEGMRDVYFELNGVARLCRVLDREAAAAGMASGAIAKKAALGVPGQVGASMPGTVADVKVEVGATVSRGDPLVVLSAMKMETLVSAPVGGVVTAVHVGVGTLVASEDLLVEVGPPKAGTAAAAGA